MSEKAETTPAPPLDKPGTSPSTSTPADEAERKKTDTSIQPAPDPAEAQTPDIVSAMPQEFQKGFALMMSMMPASPMADVAKKLTPDHITKALENADQNNQRQHEARQRESWQSYGTLWGLIFIVSLIVTLILLKRPEYFTQVMTVLGSAAGGGGGYVIWRNRRR